MKTGTKTYEINLKRFHELVCEAARQGLDVLYSDPDTCDALVDMWPDESACLDDGERLVLYDTHYSDKTGPSDGNELVDMGTIEAPKCGSIIAEEVDGYIMAVHIDRGPGTGKAKITFVRSVKSGIPVGDVTDLPSAENSVIERRFQVKDAFKVFTEELGIPEEMAEGLVFRNYWALLEKMNKVYAGELTAPGFTDARYLEEFLSRCDDVATCYIYSFDAYTGRVCMDTDDGGNIELWLGDLINETLLENPADMDEWVPWLRKNLKDIDRVIEENANPPIAWADIEMYDFSSDGEVVLRYKLT